MDNARIILWFWISRLPPPCQLNCTLVLGQTTKFFIAIHCGLGVPPQPVKVVGEEITSPASMQQEQIGLQNMLFFQNHSAYLYLHLNTVKGIGHEITTVQRLECKTFRSRLALPFSISLRVKQLNINFVGLLLICRPYFNSAIELLDYFLIWFDNTFNTI